MPIRVTQVCDFCGVENKVELETKSWFQYGELFQGDVEDAFDEDWGYNDGTLCDFVCPSCAGRELIAVEVGEPGHTYMQLQKRGE